MDAHRFTEDKATSEAIYAVLFDYNRDMYYDSGDMWGTVMGELFAVADLLNQRNSANVPSYWEYRNPSGEVSEIAEEMHLDTGDLVKYGNALWVCRELLKIKGYDY